MNDSGDEDAEDKEQKLALLLSQFRDDIDDIVTGLESGRLLYKTACVAAATQIHQMFKQLESDLQD